MIVITLGEVRDTSDDPLGRDRAGYKEGMSDLAVYDAGRGTWHLGARADRERYALFAFQGRVKLAVEISGIDPMPGGRSAITGTILGTGHPVHDRYVGQLSPVRVEGERPSRNPVRYYDAPEDHGPCLCGCGQITLAGRDFITGHDQTALYQRVKQIGTVKEFMDWFDAMTKPFATTR
jgi:hypothetical protein